MTNSVKLAKESWINTATETKALEQPCVWASGDDWTDTERRTQLCARWQRRTEPTTWDGSKGGCLKPFLVRAAGDREMGCVKKMNIYQKVPYEECFKVTGETADKAQTGRHGQERKHLVSMELRRGSALPGHSAQEAV